MTDGVHIPTRSTDGTENPFVQARDPAKDRIGDPHKAWMKIREGLRLLLTGVEELKGLPRSFETKKEQGRR